MALFNSSQYQTHNNVFLNCTPDNYQFVTPSSLSRQRSSYNDDISQTHKAETLRHAAKDHRDEVLLEVVALEVSMGIESRWQPSDTQYQETLQYMGLRKYHRMLDHLQKLVIQRHFELNKLNLAGTGKYRYPNMCVVV